MLAIIGGSSGETPGIEMIPAVVTGMVSTQNGSPSTGGKIAFLSGDEGSARVEGEVEPEGGLRSEKGIRGSFIAHLDNPGSAPSVPRK